MGIIERAVKEGVHEGLEELLAECCDGYDEPQDRCPMRPQDGCACLRVRWRKLPWWRKLFKAEPIKTSENAVLDVYVSQKVDDTLSWARAEKRRGRSNG